MKVPDLDIGRLCTAMQRARLVLARPREERVDMVRQFVGAHYSSEGAVREVPVNLVGLYTSIVGRKLVANNPRVMLSTWDKSLRPSVTAMEKWVNHEIKRLHLAETLQRVVTDALFSIGVCKVALASPADASIFSWRLAAGEPYAQRVDLDDFVFDMHARAFEEVGFIGHRFRVPTRVIRESKIYSKARNDVTATEDRIYNLEGDERIHMIGRTSFAGDEEYEDFTDLWEVYVPRHRVVLTLHDDNLTGAAVSQDSRPTDPNHGKALRIQPWLGPDSGPYHILGFSVVPGNIMPKGPVQDLIDLHESTNRIIRKLIRQADRQKEVLPVRGQATEDGDRLIETSDGEAFRCDNTEPPKPVAYGGPHPPNLQLFMLFKELFSWLAGNLDVMGGLSPQSKTAHQEEMLNQNASANVASMQDTTVTFTTRVMEALCWYWWHDPMRIMRVTHSLPGVPELSILRTVSPQQRQQGSFENLDVAVDPYSMQHQTPQTRMQGLVEMVQKIFMPLAQAAQQQGIMLDLHVLFDKIAKYMDDPDIAEILTTAPPPAEQAAGQPGAAGPPGQQPPQPDTTHNYVRRSLGADSSQAKHAAIMNMLAGSQKNAQTNGTMVNQ